MADLHHTVEMATNDEPSNAMGSEHDADSLFGSGSEDEEQQQEKAPTGIADNTTNAAVKRRGRLAVASSEDDEEGNTNEKLPSNNIDDVGSDLEKDVELFGSDSEAESALSAVKDGVTTEVKSDDEMAEPAAAIHVQLTAPSVPVSGEIPPNYYLARLPKHYHLEATPFDTASYEAELLPLSTKQVNATGNSEQHEHDNDQGEDKSNDYIGNEEEMTQKALQLRLRVQGALRWRQTTSTDTDKKQIESNAHIVTWSDGSLSLYVNGEFFDIDKQAMSNEHHYALVHHPQEGVLQVDQRLTSHLVFRPTSTTGIAAQLDAASIEKKKQTKAVLVMEDPEKQQRQQAEVEKQRLRHERKIASYTQSRMSRQSARQYGGTDLTVDDLEAEEMDDQMDIDDYDNRSRRNRSQRREREMDDFVVDDEEEEEEIRGEEDEEDEEEEEMVSHRNRRHQRYRQYSDDDDDDDDIATTTTRNDQVDKTEDD
ncbi:Leo1-like protein-domain-containing protein [Syncephalis plumigaleata]|nr:Leo1-like protein-domain-containing protein [Syncephalis plumigaleata]